MSRIFLFVIISVSYTASRPNYKNGQYNMRNVSHSLGMPLFSALGISDIALKMITCLIFNYEIK